MKKTYTPTFKAQVVQELLKETKTLTQLATDHNVHPNVLREWRTTALAGLPSLFTKADTVASLRATYEQQQEDLFAQIGRLTTQLAWLKKTSPAEDDIPPDEKRFSLPPEAIPPPLAAVFQY